MNGWFDRLRFLWEEEAPPPGEVPRAARGEPAGVPRPVRSVTRFLMVGTVAVGLMSQVIGVRLVAPVDAAPSYQAQCIQGCNQTEQQCRSTAQQNFVNCGQAANQEFAGCRTGCNGLTGMARVACQHNCEARLREDRTECNNTVRNEREACHQAAIQCRLNCRNQ